MTNYREIIRLHALNISKQRIAKVIELAYQAKMAGTFREDLSDEELQKVLFASSASGIERKKPDF